MPIQVWIRFSWTTNIPSQATNPNVWIAYGWCIDDVSLSETDPFVMEVIDQNHGGWDVGYTSTSGVGMDYTYKPKIQSFYKVNLDLLFYGLIQEDGYELSCNISNQLSDGIIGGIIFLIEPKLKKYLIKLFTKR